MSQRRVSVYQRVPCWVTASSIRGSCEFCLWQGDERPIGEYERLESELDARVHLRDNHPEKVTYWDERPV